MSLLSRLTLVKFIYTLILLFIFKRSNDDRKVAQLLLIIIMLQYRTFFAEHSLQNILYVPSTNEVPSRNVRRSAWIATKWIMDVFTAYTSSPTTTGGDRIHIIARSILSLPQTVIQYGRCLLLSDNLPFSNKLLII